MPRVYTRAPRMSRECRNCGRVRVQRAPGHVIPDLCGRCSSSANAKVGSLKRPLEERFLEKLIWGQVPPHRPDLGPCLLFTYGAPGIKNFHPRIGTGGRGTKKVTVHRYAFFRAFGRWPTPQANHHCDVKNCCKVLADERGPAHIFEGSQLDNIRDMVSKGRAAFGQRGQSLKTHCPNGHEYAGDNLIVKKNGSRRCRECVNRLQREGRAMRQG